MIIVGISGEIGSGKSTLADLFCQVDPRRTAHFETSTVVVDLANKFNALIVSDEVFDFSLDATNTLLSKYIVHLSAIADKPILLEDIALDIDDVTNQPQWYEKLFAYYKLLRKEPALAATQITSKNKSNYRDLLQWIGGYFLYRIDATMWYQELYRRINDLPSTVDFIALTAVRQPAEAEYVHSIGGQLVSIERPNNNADTTDVTERRVKEINFDITIHNDGNLHQLADLASTLRADLVAKTAAKSYRASDYIFNKA